MLHQRGVTAVNRGRHAEARALLEQALAAVRPGDLQARIQASLAYVLAETGQAPAALDLCARALEGGGLAATTRGVLHSQTGLLRMLRGEADLALASFDAAIPLLDDPHHLGRAYLNRGNVYLQRDQPRAASRDFVRADRYYAEAGDSYESAKALHNLGYSRFLEGDLVGALEKLGEAYPAFAAQGPVMTAMAEQDRAEVLMAAGLVSEGRQALRSAATTYGRRRLHQRRGEAELALARTLVQADPAEALAGARRARAQFARSGAAAWGLRAEAVVLAAEVETGRQGPSLLARTDRVAGQLDANGLRWPATSVRLYGALVAVRRGGADAPDRLATARTAGRGPLEVRLLTCRVRAELAAARGRRAEALRHLRRGLSDLHDWQSSFGSLDLQTSVAGHGTRLGVRGLALAVEAGSPAVLFEWSERARMLASRVQPVRAPQSEETVAALAELREMGHDVAAPRPVVAAREAELRRRVREQAWQHRGSGEVTDPVPLEELRAGLGGDTALVAYVVTVDRVAALVATEGSATVLDLGARAALDALIAGLRPDLDVAASDLPEPLGGFVRQELVTRLERLGRLLVTPILDVVAGRRLVLTPSGVLAGVPWTLLPGFTGRPVTVARSATMWLAGRTTPLRTGTAGFIAGPRVARAEDEVTAAAKEWGSTRVLVGDAATAAAVSDLAAGVDVLHLAAHGRHSAENPLFSGLGLADGPWFGYDIDQLTSVPDVVVLSACEVGRSTVRWGEELIGMTTAWLHAGARCVIASAAAVSDQAAYGALTLVHERLAQGVEPAEALAAAVPAVGPDAPPVPFVCFG